MGIAFRKKQVRFNRGSQSVDAVVIAHRATDVLHPGASAFLLHKTLLGAKVRSVLKYASVIMSLIEEIEYDPEIGGFDDLTDKDMSIYLESVLINERNNSESTVIQTKGILSEFFDFLYEHGFTRLPDRFTYHLSDGAELKLSKSQARQNSHDPFRLSERYIPRQQFELLLSFDRSKSQFVRDRNEIMLRLGYEAGLRAHEITWHQNLSLAEVKAALARANAQNLNEIEIRILGKGKRGGKLRTIVIEPPLRRKIVAFIENYKSLLGSHLISDKNGAELAEDYVSTIFRRGRENLIRKAAICDSDRWSSNVGWSFHATRHSYATNLALQIESGERPLGETYLMDRLGHNHPATTMIYLHFAAAMLGNLSRRDEYEKRMISVSFAYDTEEFSYA